MCVFFFFYSLVGVISSAGACLSEGTELSVKRKMSLISRDFVSLEIFKISGDHLKRDLQSLCYACF